MYPGAHLEDSGSKPAVVMAGSGWTQTYRELDDAANRLSRWFRSVGLNAGQHVALCMENNPRFLEVLWGAEYAGLIYTAVSSRLTPTELAYIINDCGARVFIASQATAHLAAEARSACPVVEQWLLIDGTADGFNNLDAVTASFDGSPLPDRVAGADMLYSSGTTGRPKGILPSVGPTPLEERTMPVAYLLELLFAMTSDKVYLSPAPLYHAAPLRFCMSSLAVGATVVVMERFDPAGFLTAVERHRATHSQMVPTMFVRLLKLDAADRERYDVSSLEMVVHAAAPCPIEVKTAMIEWFGPIIHEYYAGTEGNGFVYCDSEMWLQHQGTVGTPIGCEIHIVDDDGNEVPTGATGTVYFEGGGSFEYHHDPHKTAESRHPAGWTTLGDIGHLDADGYLYLTDRKAYTIISGGVNVYPQEAEDILTMHPDVFDVAVFGIPDPDFGEAVTAVVQPVDMPADVDEAAALERRLIEHCKQRLASLKCPRSISFRAELPRHPTGKLYKRELQAEAYERLGQTPPWKR